MKRTLDGLIRYGLWLALAVGLIIRIIIAWILPQPIVSDSIAYMHMADALAHGRPMVDNFGQYAFYSPGYPILLAGPFAFFGSSLSVAIGVNLICAAMLILLAYWLAREISTSRIAPPIAAIATALWIPNAFAVGIIGKENFSTPLLIGYALMCLILLHSNRRRPMALLAGLLFGLGVLVGGSVLFTAFGFIVTLAFIHGHAREKAIMTAAFLMGTAIILLPWLIHVRAVLGKSMLSTNAAFNLYLGNNPAATGWYISIADTPIGPHWHMLSKQLGEAGTAVYLQREASSYILGHPIQSILLGLKKLWLFWLPNLPDAADFAANAKLAMARYVDVGQYLLVLFTALIALVRAPWKAHHRWIILAVILSFWAIHGITYIIPRYRDPIMPILITIAAMAIAPFFDRYIKEPQS